MLTDKSMSLLEAAPSEWGLGVAAVEEAAAADEEEEVGMDLTGVLALEEELLFSIRMCSIRDKIYNEQQLQD